MAKFLLEASYTAEGVRGLAKDKASGRLKAATQATKALGGKIEAFYYAFGDNDVIIIADFPDNASAAALSLAVAASGLVRIKTTPLLAVADVDKALGKNAAYRAPGT